jgi:hypothetical protein
MRRRDVLKGLAGTAALCALPTSAIAVPAARGSGPSHFALMLGGGFSGFLQSAEGGNARADVIVERPKDLSFARKHLGAPSYEEITIEVGANMDKGVYDWIKSMLDLKPVRQSGAIVATDSDYATLSTLEFSDARLTEVGIPRLDGSSKEVAFLTIKFAPAHTRSTKGDGSKIEGVAAGKADAKWLSSNFRLSIAGLESVVGKVNKIDAMTVKQKIVPIPKAALEKRENVQESGTLEVSNLVFSVVESAAGPLYDWHEDFVVNGNNSQDKEKSGVLEYLSADLKPLLTVQLSGLGVFRVDAEKPTSNNDVVRRVRAELYCEELHLN